MNEAQKRLTVDGLIVLDALTSLTWTREDATEDAIAFDEVEPTVASFNENAIGGFTDWRVPTVEELFLLADRSKVNPAIDTEAFPNCKSESYWSSTRDAEDPDDYAWVVDFYYGDSGIDGRGDRRRLRLVRGPSRQ